MTQDDAVAEPIATHLAALAARPFPEDALRACVARFDEVRRPLRASLDRAAAGKPLSDSEWLSFFRGLYVLAAARDADSFASLLRLLRRPADDVDDLLGDAVTVSLARILISLFDGDAEALLALVAERNVEEYVRGAVLTAAAWLTWKGQIDRALLRHHLLAVYETRAAEDGSFVWYAWMRAVALLDFGDFLPLVEAAWKAKRIDHSMLEWSEFRTDVARARTAYEDASRFDPFSSGTIDDVVAELDWTRHWAEEGGAAEPNGMQNFGDWEQPTPAVNPYRNVGRNDPCPCGSGKKAKKCCLASG